MQKIFFSLLAFFLLAPMAASAHAVPTSYAPDSSSVVATAPVTVQITFSERIDIAASSIRVTGPDGALASVGKPVATDDPRTIYVPLASGADGAYLVAWSVVSSDDGHFTKGTYPFAVGAGALPPEATASSEVVKLATTPEALAMTVELFGHGLLWAVLILFAFAVRPLLSGGAFASDERTVRRGYALFLYAGIVLVLVGAVFQLYTKSVDLASLDGSPFLEALLAYLQTAAGSATCVRIGAVAILGTAFIFGRKVIAAAKRVTAYEFVMFAALIVFAFFRAKISHATANPFFPELSIAINVIHLIEKDIWAGILMILAFIALIPRLRGFLDALIGKAFIILSANLALVAITASYIVWLHLKSFDNLLTTEWGTAFIVLLVAASLLVALRTYHVIARRYAPGLFARFLPLTLAKECALAILVIYASSVVIITSPPLETGHARTFSAHEQGISIGLATYPYEDGMALLTIAGSDAVPAVEASGNGAVFDIALAERFAGGYVFPYSLLAGTGTYTLDIIVPNTEGYDAHTEFTLRGTDLVPSNGTHGGRTLDIFTLSMCGIALAALAFAFVLYRIVRIPAYASSVSLRSAAFITAPALFLVVLSLGGVGMNALAVSPLVNPFKAQCIADGNMWHFMLPSKAGTPVSATPREGCMWGMGNQMYMFADKREYDFYRALSPAEVALQKPADIVPGVPATLTFRLTESDGTPATLFYDMEKLIHVVIVSEDQTVFAHIHADDAAPLTDEAIRTSTFSVSYTFPKAGKYLVSADYAHGITLESKQFLVDVGAAPAAQKIATYDSVGTFGGYQVALRYDLPTEDGVVTLRYHISKDGVPVTNLEQYLSAAMHISAVKNDLSVFAHTHGEIHPPGTPYPPIIVRNGKIVHSMASMILPPTFGPDVEAHVIFPEPGLYTVWGQFKADGVVIPTAFTVRID